MQKNNTTGGTTTVSVGNINIPGGGNTSESAGYNWVEINDRQFLVHNVNLSYIRAVEYCKRLEAAIVSFTNPVQYVLLQRDITLKGKYWVGGGIQSADDNCLVLGVTKSSSLSSASCVRELYSICSRVANVSNVLNHPAFVKLIQNMTINDHETNRMERKLNCALDNRTSAKAVGALVGAGVIAIIGILPLLSDLQNIYQNVWGHR